MATVSLLLYMVAAQLLSSCLGQQCACGTTSGSDFDFRDCEFEDVLLNKIDRNNSLVCQRYNTQSFDGFEDCFFQSPENTPVTPLQEFADIEDNYAVFRIFSPNHHNTTCCYPSQMFCGYNVQCQPGQLLYYRIVRLDLQNKDDDLGLCNDRLSVLRDSHSSREVITCGKDTSLQWEEKDEPAPPSGTEFEKLQVKFYSSRDCHNCGFFMFAFCVNQEQYNQPGCDKSIPTIGKRDASSKPNNKDNPWAGYHSHRRRNIRFRSYPIVVPVGARMTYQNRIVRIFKNDKLWREFRSIQVLQEYDTVFKFETHYGSSRFVYNGFGVLYVGIGIVQYIQEGVKPDLKPTPGEDEVIATILREIVFTDQRIQNDRLNFRPTTGPTMGTPTTGTTGPTNRPTSDPTSGTTGTTTGPTTGTTTPVDPTIYTKKPYQPGSPGSPGSPGHPGHPGRPGRRFSRQVADEFCPTDPSKGTNTCLFMGTQVGKRSTTAAECAQEASQSCNGIVRSVGEFFMVRTTGTGRT